MNNAPGTAKDAARRLASGAIAQGFKPEALHEYRSADGGAIYWRIRAKRSDGEKWIRPMHLNGHGYELGEPKFPAGKPLYNLDRIAADPTARVWIVEGEKAADAISNLGVIATTSGGAASAEAADWTPLRGRDCIIWPDFDDAGKGYAGEVGNALVGLNCKLACVDVEKLAVPPKGDAADWAQSHPNATPSDLESLPLLPHQPLRNNATAADLGPDHWPEPLPLPDGLPPVASFDFALLPSTLQAWARDVCDRMQCPPDFVGVTIMAALGSVIGRKVGIRPQSNTDWTVIPNQWALLVGRPGVMKSPAMEAALSPLKRLAAKSAESYQAEAKDFELAARVAKLQAEAGEKAARGKLANNPDANVSDLLRADTPEAPNMRRYIANDTSPASLGELLRHNPNGILNYRDELVPFLMSLDREENSEARAFYLTGWNGDSGHTIDRIGRGMNLHIDAVCISLLGSTQPGRIAKYVHAAVKGGSGDDGLIQRFGLTVFPDAGGEWQDVDRIPDTQARRDADRVFDYLDGLDPMSVDAQQDDFGGVPYLRLGTEAHGLFLEWRNELEKKLRSGELHNAVESHLAKYRKLVPGLALIIHLAERRTGPIGQQAMLQALAWAQYLETHANRLYASGINQEVAAAKAILLKLRGGQLPTTFSSRDVWRPGWANLADRDQVSAALRMLADLDWIGVSSLKTEGRTATAYTANPRGL